MPIRFRAELRTFLDEFADAHSGIRLGRMFGRPALYVGRRLFATVNDDGLAVRLPADVAAREVRNRGRRYSRRAGPSGLWVLYRPRTIVDARRLSPVLEIAARHLALSHAEDRAGAKVLSRR